MPTPPSRLRKQNVVSDRDGWTTAFEPTAVDRRENAATSIQKTVPSSSSSVAAYRRWRTDDGPQCPAWHRMKSVNLTESKPPGGRNRGGPMTAATHTATDVHWHWYLTWRQVWKEVNQPPKTLGHPPGHDHWPKGPPTNPQRNHRPRRIHC